MKTFKEMLIQLDEKPTMSLAQRRKKAIQMKKLAKTSSFQKKREKKMSRMSSKEDLLKRAMKAAKIKMIEKMGISKADYNAMAPQQKMMIDKKLESKSAAIKKMATKMLPAMKKQEMERIKQMKSSEE